MQRIGGWVEAGNTTLTITGAAGTITRKVQGSFPSATITVYLASTVTLAPIYSDNALTVKANPFTAASDGTWFFYVADGVYDVNFSGGSISAPFTIGAVPAFDPQRPNLVRDAATFPGANAGAKILSAIADIPSTGGTVDCRGFEGAQTITAQILVTKSNITFLFGASTFTCSGVTPTQSPFVAAIFQVTANNVWFIGTSATVFKLAAGCTANVFTFGKSTTSGGSIGGGVVGIEMDGNKANNTSGTDDTFQTGVAIIETIAAGATADASVTVQNCLIHDFNHNGITTFGEWANATTISGNRIYNNGKTDTNGTGVGVYLQSSRNVVQDNYIYLNSRDGVRLCSAGIITINGNQILNNFIYENTLNGILAVEEADLGSMASVGNSWLMIIGNSIFLNSQYGIRVSTANNVGYITNFVISGNVVSLNTLDGIITQGNNDGTNNTRQGVITGNQFTANTGHGVNIASTSFDMAVSSNDLIGNTGGTYTDGGTRTLIAGNKTNTSDSVFYTNAGIIALTGDVAASAGNLSASNVSGNDVKVTLNQVGVKSWVLRNVATTGTLFFTQGGSDWIQVTPDTGATTFAGKVTDTGHLFAGSTPTAPSGQIGIGGTVSASANAGATQAVPATVLGYIVANVAGTAVKIPYFSN